MERVHKACTQSTHNTFFALSLLVTAFPDKILQTFVKT